MINFFESNLQTQNTDKKKKTYKAITIGVSLLTAAGIGIKTGSVMDMFYDTYERLTSPSYQKFF